MMKIGDMWNRRPPWATVPILLLCACAAIGYAVYFGENEHGRIASPDGRYIAIATYPLWEALTPRFAGQGSDKRGFIRIEGSDGVNYGKIPVPIVTFIHDVRWERDGASIAALGEWHFSQREYRYWNEDQTRQYVKHAD